MLAKRSIETGTASPMRQYPYRVPHGYKDIVQQELKEMLAEGIVPSNSDWAAPTPFHMAL